MIDKYTYRIFLTKTKEMCFVHSIHFGTRKVIVSSKCGNHSVPLKGNILMEDTGIRDINNKRIYEGDILRLRIDDNKIINVYVKWDKQKYKLISKKHYHMPAVASLKDLTRSEVIGNIYEDFILLEGGD